MRRDVSNPGAATSWKVPWTMSGTALVTSAGLAAFAAPGFSDLLAPWLERLYVF